MIKANDMILKKKSSLLEETVQDLFEFTGVDWEAGAVVTLFMGCMTIFFFKWAVHETGVRYRSSLLPETILGLSGWLIYLLPIAVLLITVLFALQTFKTYQGQRSCCY